MAAISELEFNSLVEQSSENIRRKDRVVFGGCPPSGYSVIGSYCDRDWDWVASESFRPSEPEPFTTEEVVIGYQRTRFPESWRRYELAVVYALRSESISIFGTCEVKSQFVSLPPGSHIPHEEFCSFYNSLCDRIRARMPEVTHFVNHPAGVTPEGILTDERHLAAAGLALDDIV